MINALPGAVATEIRKKEQLEEIDGLIIPGGESTTMALVAEEWGLLTALQEFSKTEKPIWGTCAGLIFLAKNCTGGDFVYPHPSDDPPPLINTEHEAIYEIVRKLHHIDSCCPSILGSLCQGIIEPHCCACVLLPRCFIVLVQPVRSRAARP